MGKIFTEKITRFDTGIVADERTPGNGARVISNFDVLTKPNQLVPYRSSESGDSSASTSQKQNFCIAETSDTSYLFALGKQSANARAEVLRKSLSTGGSQDLSDATWATPANNQASSGATLFDCFVHYKKTGKIYGIAGSAIWGFDAASSGAWVDSEQSLTTGVTSTAQGLVHSKDDILYIPYRNTTNYTAIAKNDNGSWTTNALLLPRHVYITSLSEYGNFIAVATAPISYGGLNSFVYLWDRDTSLATLSDSIDWGTGSLKVLEEVNGYLVGISVDSTNRFKSRVHFKTYAGTGGAKSLFSLEADSSATLVVPIAKQKKDGRIYFMMSIYLNGSQREGVWSIGPTEKGWTLIHERTPNNDTALSAAGLLYNFIFAGDYLFQSYNTSSAFALSKTDDQENYNHTSVWESVIYNGGDSSLKKKLIGVTVTYDPLPTNGSVVLKYKKDAETSFTQIFSDTTDNSISHGSVKVESTSETLPDYKEIQFRLESSGGAKITGIEYTYEVMDKSPYSK